MKTRKADEGPFTLDACNWWYADKKKILFVHEARDEYTGVHLKTDIIELSHKTIEAMYAKVIHA
jgi:hypothetical protein